MTISPVAAARNTMTAGAVPPGTPNLSVNSEDPASTKADTTPRTANGHNSSANPTYATTSHTASWNSKIAAASVASSWSRRRESAERDSTSWYAPSTVRSTHRVSLEPTERVTTSVPMTL